MNPFLSNLKSVISNTSKKDTNVWLIINTERREDLSFSDFPGPTTDKTSRWDWGRGTYEEPCKIKLHFINKLITCINTYYRVGDFLKS